MALTPSDRQPKTIPTNTTETSYKTRRERTVFHDYLKLPSGIPLKLVLSGTAYPEPAVNTDSFCTGTRQVRYSSLPHYWPPGESKFITTLVVGPRNFMRQLRPDRFPTTCLQNKRNLQMRHGPRIRIYCHLPSDTKRPYPHPRVENYTHNGINFIQICI